jgi:hypothetical protein
MRAENELKTEGQIQIEFRKKRMLFRLLVAGLLALTLFYERIAHTADNATTIDDTFTLGGVVLLITAAWAVFRCPGCRAWLKQSHWLPWRRTLYCPRCGVKLSG